MRFEVNIEKKYAFLIVGIILALGIGGYVYAFNVGLGNVPNPGHALTTIQGYFSGDADLNASLGKFCQSDGVNCVSSGGAGTCPVGQVVMGVSSGGGVVCGPNSASDCIGEGRILRINEGSIDDGSIPISGAYLDIYCRNGIARWCLVGANSNPSNCPWVTNIASNDGITCWREGLSQNATKMAWSKSGNVLEDSSFYAYAPYNRTCNFNVCTLTPIDIANLQQFKEYHCDLTGQKFGIK